MRILTRFKRHLVEQNWLGLGLDVIVIVIGLFLGFQLDDWNQERIDRELETSYLNRLHEDYKINLGQLNEQLEQIELRAKNLSAVVQHLSAGTVEEISDAEVFSSFCNWYITETVRIRSATFDELISTSQLRVIKDETLRDLIQTVESELARGDQDLLLVTPTVTKIAYELQPYIYWSFDKRPDSEILVYQPDTSGTVLSEITCKVDLQKIQNDKQVISILTQLYRGMTLGALLRKLQIQTIEDAITQIKIHINRDS